MTPRGTLVLLAVIGGCASARNEPPEDDAAVATIDAPRQLDAAAPRDSSSGCAFTGVLATWSFTGEAGNQASTVSASTATGVTATAVHRSAALTAVSGLNSINSSNWPTAAALDATKYYALTIAPPSGCAIALSSLAIDAKASSTGPTAAKVATSIDTFAQTTTISTSVAGTVALVTTAQMTMVELRVFGYGASSTAGTLRLQMTLSITGWLQ